MSKAAERWIAARTKLYSAGPGTPNICVKHITCSYCKAQPGELCRGPLGPTLAHHSPRSSAMLALRRRMPGLTFREPLSDDYLAKAQHRLETMRVTGTVDQRLHDLTQAVANLVDYLKKRRR